MTHQAFPLHWPPGWPRTRHPETARFRVTPDQARRELEHEIDLMGARNLVISTNVPLRRDGLPYASARAPDDRGVAIYFDLAGEPKVFPCDRWDQVFHNIQALKLTIEALRGLDRWGAGEMTNRAFTGFTALPAPKTCWEILGLSQEIDAMIDARASIQVAYRRLAATAHPDQGGSDTAMAELNRARDEALREIER